MRRLAVALSLASLCACKSPPDPLAEQKAQCQSLLEQKQLRAGLTIEACAVALKAAADARDPALRAEELVQRVQGLVAAGKGGQSEGQRTELRDALGLVQEIGRPAVPALQSRLSGSQDPDLRIAVARALVSICAADCAEQKFDCIVPALLEGTTGDKPAEVRIESIKGLTRCTGQPFGDDSPAWRSWWAEQAKTAAR